MTVDGYQAEPYLRIGQHGIERNERSPATFYNQDRYALAAIGTTSLVMLIGAAGAFAHIQPDPVAVQAGASATVAFGVEHGCACSNTTSLDLQIPAGVTNAAAVTKNGWTTTITANVVSFTGGNLDAKTPDTFSITFTAPTESGTIYFPVVQKCVKGETDWIQIAADGAPEPTNPAPAVKVTSGPPTSADLVVVEDTPTTSFTAVSKPNDSGHAGLIIGIGAVVVVIAGTVTFLRSKNKRGGATS